MTSQRPNERHSWTWAVAAVCNLLAAAMLYAADMTKGRPASTSAGLGFVLIGLSNVLGGWHPPPSSSRRRTLFAVQIALALAGVAWMAICLSR